jgi:hypothetical protein
VIPKGLEDADEVSNDGGGGVKEQMQERRGKRERMGGGSLGFVLAIISGGTRSVHGMSD